MPKLPACPPIVPPAFEPSPAARDALERAERTHREASEAARTAEDNARSAKVATADAQRAFGDDDSDERWRELEAARRRETSAQLRAERCAAALTTVAAELAAARSTVEAERIEHARERASTLRLIENMREPIELVARATRDLIEARERMAAAEREHYAAFNAMRTLTGDMTAPPPPSPLGLGFAQFAAGVVALEFGASKSPLSDGVSFGPGESIELGSLVMPRWRQSLPLSPEADALLRVLALEAIG
jgi:hypothetical protein